MIRLAQAKRVPGRIEHDNPIVGELPVRESRAAFKRVLYSLVDIVYGKVEMRHLLFLKRR